MAIAAAIIAGGAVAAAGVGAYSASKAAKASKAQTDAANQQSALARELYNQGAGVRDTGTNALNSFLESGNLPVSLALGRDANRYGLEDFLSTGVLPGQIAPGALPPVVRPGRLPAVADVTAYDRDVLEQQFGRARESTISQAPTQGGRLASSLTDLEGARALGVTGIYSAQQQREFEQANRQYALDYGAATGQQQQDLGAIQANDALRRSLYGTGIDLAQQDASQERALRSQLFGQALGVGYQDSGLALQGLQGASQGFGNVASTALKGTELGVDALAAVAGYGVGGLAKKKNTGLYDALFAAQDPLGGGAGYTEY